MARKLKLHVSTTSVPGTGEATPTPPEPPGGSPVHPLAEPDLEGASTAKRETLTLGRADLTHSGNRLNGIGEQFLIHPLTGDSAIGSAGEALYDPAGDLKIVAEDAGAPDWVARERLAAALLMRVPDLRVRVGIAAGTAKRLACLLMPGDGELGVKTFNDELIGLERNKRQLVPKRQEAIGEAMQNLGRPDELFDIVRQDHKTALVITNVEDPVRFRELMTEALRIIDARVLADTRAVLEGVKSALERVVADPKRRATREMKARLLRVTRLLRKLPTTARQWRGPVVYGSAPIEADQGTDYRDILRLRMSAERAARTAQLWGTRRGAEFDPEHMRELAARATTLRTQLMESGNVLYVRGSAQTIFIKDRFGDLVPNRFLLRALRKGKLNEEVVPKEQHDMLTELEQYVSIAGTLDYVLDATTSEINGVVNDQLHSLARVLDQLRGGASVDTATLGRFLSPTFCDETIARVGTQPEALFFQRNEGYDQRLMLSTDIRDLGLDGLEARLSALHTIDEQQLDEAGIFEQALMANDRMQAVRRSVFSQILTSYEGVRDLLAANEDAPPALAKETRPIFMLGGDEMVVSAHPVISQSLSGLIAEVHNTGRCRAVASWSHAPDPAPGHCRHAHDKALRAADVGMETLKAAEDMDRNIQLAIERTESPEVREELRTWHAGLGLMQMFVEIDEPNNTFEVRRTDTGDPVDIDALVDHVREKLGQ